MKQEARVATGPCKQQQFNNEDIWNKLWEELSNMSQQHRETQLNFCKATANHFLGRREIFMKVVHADKRLHKDGNV